MDSNSHATSSFNTLNVNRRNLLLGSRRSFRRRLGLTIVGRNSKEGGRHGLPSEVRQDSEGRPVVNRTKEDKKKANEILLVNGIEFDGEKFDVFVNDKDDETKITPVDSEFAGSFASSPHGKTDKMMMMTSGVRFGLINGLLEDIKAEDDGYVLVTLMPRSGCDDVTVSEIKIELVPIV